MNQRGMVGALSVFVGLVLVLLIADRYLPPAQAMTASSNDKKTLVTVPLDAGLEAVVTLDHTTGDLTGYVINRVTRLFYIRYRYNITNDFPGTRGEYLMGTGLADFRGFSTNERVASGVVYITEASTSQVAAYAIPWTPELATSQASPQELQFIPLDRAQTRFTRLRDESR